MDDNNSAPSAGQPQYGKPQNGQPQNGQSQGGDTQASQPQTGQPQNGQPRSAPQQSGTEPVRTDYTVQNGNSLSDVAQTFGVPLELLLAANPQIADPNVIYPGQQINYPAQVYTVRSGDTLSNIAAQNGIELNTLVALNPQITDPNQISTGQLLRIPASLSNALPAYNVQPGDTLSNIAAQYGVNLNTLIALNPQIADPNQIVPGQLVKIPASLSSSPLAYGVRTGDTLSTIAAQYGINLQTLLALNPEIANIDTIFPGQIIRLPSPSGSSNDSAGVAISNGAVNGESGNNGASNNGAANDGAANNSASNSEASEAAEEAEEAAEEVAKRNNDQEGQRGRPQMGGNREGGGEGGRGNRRPNGGARTSGTDTDDDRAPAQKRSVLRPGPKFRLMNRVRVS